MYKTNDVFICFFVEVDHSSLNKSFLSLLLIFFCQIVADVTETKDIKAASTPYSGNVFPISKLG